MCSDHEFIAWYDMSYDLSVHQARLGIAMFSERHMHKLTCLLLWLIKLILVSMCLVFSI